MSRACIVLAPSCTACGALQLWSVPAATATRPEPSCIFVARFGGAAVL